MQASCELEAIARMETEQTLEKSKQERLLELATEASTCTRCALSQTRSNVVFGEGNPEAPLVFVGEGPGQNEDSTGRPFVGRSGVLLDECMAANGIKRKHIYICNILRCRACVMEGGRLQNRPPTPEETSACTPWLVQTLDIIQPYVIVCLGAPAANFIIHKNFKLMQERGKWFESRFCRFATATLHPAYILRLEGEAYEAARQNLIADIEVARQKVIEAKRQPKMSLF